MIAVYSEVRMKQIRSVGKKCRRIAEVFNIRAGGIEA